MNYDEIIGRKLGGILCQSDTHKDVSPDREGYYLSNGSVLLRYVRDVPLIKEMFDEVRAQTIVEIANKEGKNVFTPKTTAELIELLKKPNTQVTMTTETLQDILKNESDRTRIEILKTIIAHMRVARSGMCLKDREILLRELNRLEAD